MSTTKQPNRFTEHVARIAEIRREMIALGKKAFAEESQAIFEQFPLLEAFSWKQYTPYFNDGDTCTFGVDNFSFGMKLNGMEEVVDDGYGPDNDADQAIWDEHSELLDEINGTLSEFIGGIPEDVMLGLFGDHAQITINRDGSSVIDSYDHE